MVSIWRIWYCINLKSPNWVFFFILLTYLLDSWYCRKKFYFDHSGVKALSGETLLTKLGLMSVLISWDGGWGLRPKSQSEVKQIQALPNYLPTLHWKLLSRVITPTILEILPQHFSSSTCFRWSSDGRIRSDRRRRRIRTTLRFIKNETNQK